MQYLHTNNASTTLRTAITSVTQLTVVVPTGHGTLFPNPATADQGFFITVEDRRSGRLEIMLCTSRVGDTLNVRPASSGVTIGRGQQGTVPQTFAIGVSVANRITAQILNEFVAATVDVVAPARIPPITNAMIDPVAGLDAATTKSGVFATARIPKITNAMIDPVAGIAGEAIKSGAIDPARITAVNAAALPAIPAAKLTSVPAESLTGLIAAARITDESISDVKISDMAAPKLTGVIHQNRLPETFTVTGGVTVGGLVVTNNVNIGGAITAVDSVTSVGPIVGKIQHRDDGGYLYVGSYDTATYGSGYGRIYWDQNQTRFVINNGSLQVTGMFIGSGAGLTGIPISSIIADANDVGTVAMLRYEGGSTIHPGTTVNAGTSGSGLKYANVNGQASATVYPPNGSIWRCFGLANGVSGDSGDRTTIWRRVS